MSTARSAGPSMVMPRNDARRLAMSSAAEIPLPEPSPGARPRGPSSSVRRSQELRSARRGAPFAVDVAGSEAEGAVVQRKDVVVVAAHALRGTAGAVDRVAGQRGKVVREKPLQHLAGDLAFA